MSADWRKCYVCGGEGEIAYSNDHDPQNDNWVQCRECTQGRIYSTRMEYIKGIQRYLDFVLEFVDTENVAFEYTVMGDD